MIYEVKSQLSNVGARLPCPTPKTGGKIKTQMNFMGVIAGGEYYTSQLLAFGYSHPLILISLSLIPIGIPAR